ncbi:hypothetical protein [uncultured Duncaniella sp.]|uniref:hypothetical protein n=1 Tax=uncultured Duncaniella sp. TaxID=2768039 RepID=UPI002595E747|nr:hypothetical protein [uncultured Duncaniella sp.]
MNKKKITYGVSGMMEYQAVVKVGKKNVSINFSDGSISAMGTNPATFTTSNIIIQNAIEASNDFKRGRISIVRSIDLAEELPIFRNAPAPAPVPAKQTKGDEPAEHENAPAEEVETAEEIAEQVTEQTEAETPEASEEPATTEEPANLTQVEFSCNDDAKDYLEQTFGLIRSKLRNREDIVNAGKQNGVEILFV